MSLISKYLNETPEIQPFYLASFIWLYSLNVINVLIILIMWMHLMLHLAPSLFQFDYYTK